MALFTGVVVVLAAVVLTVHRLLLSGEAVTVTVNGQRSVSAAAGERLLWSLADAGILLPAACGGRGSCGQCRVRVLQGGGPLLPTEANHISRRQAAAGERLACMVSLHGDLAVEVPPAVLSARPWEVRVAASRHLTPFLKELTLCLPEGQPMRYEPGDYVLLEAPTGRVTLADIEVPGIYRDDWAPLRDLGVDIDTATTRAYSLASFPGEAAVIKLVIRLAEPPPSAPPGAPPGRVTSWAFTLKPGDSARLSGPFGTFHLRDTPQEKVFIGGGAGIAPLRAMIFSLLAEPASTAPLSFWYGARNPRELCYRDEFEDLARRHANFRYCAAISEPTADGSWSGPSGFIHNVLHEQHLRNHPAPEEAEYYLCGPPLMTRAVITLLEDYGVDRSSILLDDFGT